ncbi:uncharacterized protein EI90DRAFT_90998 [Cantharellus anzutake]|uniref:uncharacterized protein n=1 Tax=Cantharellus anzutake TaxID=1750568 RepID=UPI001905363E|nr:uncharacterized protein EI90DRAFT_90998 [Cantharellus anzutake]KAF8336955.1 hypothetical protein EI90DRAFT_90998 [Cantharellus anzutake]
MRAARFPGSRASRSWAFEWSQAVPRRPASIRKLYTHESLLAPTHLLIRHTPWALLITHLPLSIESSTQTLSPSLIQYAETTHVAKSYSSDSAIAGISQPSICQHLCTNMFQTIRRSRS